MANEASKLYAAQQAHIAAQKGQGDAAKTDAELDEKRHDRAYNPVDEAKRGSVSAELNSDSARYRKGPGPL